MQEQTPIYYQIEFHRGPFDHIKAFVLFPNRGMRDLFDEYDRVPESQVIEEITRCYPAAERLYAASMEEELKKRWSCSGIKSDDPQVKHGNLHLFERAIIKRGEHRGAWVVIERLIDTTAWVELVGSAGGLLAFERDDLLGAWCPYCKQVIKPEQSIIRFIDDESDIVQVHHLDCGIQDGDLLVSESGSSLTYTVMQRRDGSWEPYGGWTLYDLATQCELQRLEKIESRPDEFSTYTGVYRQERGLMHSEHVL